MKVRSKILVFLHGLSNFRKLTGFCRKEAFVFTVVKNLHGVSPFGWGRLIVRKLNITRRCLVKINHLKA